MLMVELSPLQMQVMERLLEAGFRPIAIPPYENALCIRKGEYVAALAPVPNAGLKLLAPPSYLVDGNFSVKLKRRYLFDPFVEDGHTLPGRLGGVGRQHAPQAHVP